MRPTHKEVRAQFVRYNAAFWGGALPEVPVHWARFRHYGEWCPPDTFEDLSQYPVGVIYLSTMGAPLKGGWRGVLLHEMVHAWQYLTEVEDAPEGGTVLEGHAENFTSECNRIGSLLGMPPIAIEESWSWPWGLWDPRDLSDHHE